MSDTHGVFCPKVKNFLSQCDEIWHCGDIGTLECADEIKAFKPLMGVYGNIDDYKIRMEYPEFNYFTREGLKVLMTHIGGYPKHYDYRAEKQIKELSPNIFISGHSHILKVINDNQYNLIHINPGACGSHGFHRVKTAIRLTIDKGALVDMEVGEWNR